MTRKRKKKQHWQLTVRLTIQQGRALDDKAFAEGVPMAVKAKHMLADALNVPRETLSETLGESFLDVKPKV